MPRGGGGTVSDFELQPRTELGRKFVDLAEQHAQEVARHASGHDEEGSFPVEAIDDMRTTGFLTAAVPQEFGGMGLSSLHDVMVGMSRLGRGDGSIAIAVSMHFAISSIVARMLRGARERGDDSAAAGLEQFLAGLGAGAIAMANATEAGTDVRYPMTEVTPVEGGWRVDGRKTFGTLSPVADLMVVTCRHRREDGSYAGGTAIVFRGTPGQTILDNWDALGMRASGSNDVLYENCVIPHEMFFEESDWGELDEGLLVIGTGGNVGLLGAFVGIAESARAHVVDLLQRRTKQPTGRPLAERRGIQHAMAELDVELNTCRAHLSWVGTHCDRTLVERSVTAVSRDDLHQLMAAFQASKLSVQRGAITVVDKALQLSGGAGYLRANPLARLYRDVRAGPFMQPLSANDAHEYIGRVALGQPPVIED
jgi:alkylation response protein AidB-like acyl-CoA dehydrogenase